MQKIAIVESLISTRSGFSVFFFFLSSPATSLSNFFSSSSF